MKGGSALISSGIHVGPMEAEHADDGQLLCGTSYVKQRVAACVAQIYPTRVIVQHTQKGLVVSAPSTSVGVTASITAIASAFRCAALK
jgi:hypothetical protein